MRFSSSFSPPPRPSQLSVKLNPPTPPRISVASAPSRKTSHGPPAPAAPTSAPPTPDAPGSRPGPQRHHSRFPRHRRLLRRRSFPHVRRSRRPVPHLPHLRRRPHWQLQFTATNPKSFFDSIAFWDSTHGIVLGDPIPDEKGQLKFELLMTNDGQTWSPAPPLNFRRLEAEGAFAASNSCIAILNLICRPK